MKSHAYKYLVIVTWTMMLIICVSETNWGEHWIIQNGAKVHQMTKKINQIAKHVSGQLLLFFFYWLDFKWNQYTGV